MLAALRNDLAVLRITDCNTVSMPRGLNESFAHIVGVSVIIDCLRLRESEWADVLDARQPKLLEMIDVCTV